MDAPQENPPLYHTDPNKTPVIETSDDCLGFQDQDDTEEYQDDAQQTSQSSSRTTLVDRIPTMGKLVRLQRVIEHRVLGANVNVKVKDFTPDPDNSVANKDLAGLVKAWRDLELLRRIMLGKPTSVEPARLKLPKPRKLGLLAPISDLSDVV